MDDRILTCYSCGNTGRMEYIADFDEPNFEKEYTSTGELLYSQLLDNINWVLYKCPVCNKPILVGDYTCQSYSESQAVYPSFNINYEGVPKEIRSAFESAVKTKKIDKAICLLSLRRTLEMICRDKQAVGRTLEEKVQFLINEKVLPEMLGDACWIIRQNGNGAAHGDNVSFSDYEVDECIEYLASLINFLYSMPIRVKSLKERIINRKTGK